jgi:predicted dehydrogenase
VSSFRGVTEGDITRYALEKREPLKTEHEAFQKAILTGDHSGIVTLAEGLRVVEIAERLVADGLSHRIH